ncbi:CsbD family protein [Candidatus Viadribacter manganicus]|uniref:CsbD family protein n=1 Tax=Candidatus Viadribacter manganicus TaxID=1759059 RepID=UPI00082B3CF9|nr:CsbD family protein [Candidatus Viadribacter manganicus]
MDNEHVKGAADKVSGAVKEGVGKATGDASLEAKGKIDTAKGQAREALGDAKDAMKKPN